MNLFYQRTLVMTDEPKLFYYKPSRKESSKCVNIWWNTKMEIMARNRTITLITGVETFVFRC